MAVEELPTQATRSPSLRRNGGFAVSARRGAARSRTSSRSNRQRDAVMAVLVGDGTNGDCRRGRERRQQLRWPRLRLECGRPPFTRGDTSMMRKSILLALLAVGVVGAALLPAADADSIKLFNGKDFTGWRKFL